ncbi:MAG: Myo-inositol 2-dehydrogenase 1 [Candidatus Jettenia ecosi]|uniref:Myo-inositol 2-dehydrogenase 1 n=1 Tax=Candidatus Jettenia ecosi TaxID=2494326 RepID=A0A533QPB6_9BACT|nr:MAG: Myo-inositol 2-dehydrogenase 1 [Candidatus Jettenia ecosi]
MLKAGFIGMGRMGITHFSILNAHPSVKTVAICDQSKTILNFFKKYVGVNTFSDYDKMIQESGLDFVVISTPTDSHAEIIKAAIANNLHIFVEKPLATSSVQGNEILRLLNGRSLVNQVGYVNRFNEVFMQVKQLLDEGLIGEIKNFTFEMFGCTVSKDSKSSWRSNRNLGGGCMYEFASHCIDLVVYLIGQPNKVIGNVLQSIFSSDVEDLVSSTFIYDNRCVGNILVNWSELSYRKPTNRIEICGKKGKIVADKHAYKVFLKESDESHTFHTGWNTRYITDCAEGVHFYVRGNEFSRQLSYFVDFIEKKRANNTSNFAEALKTDIVMEEIFNNCMEIKK